MSNHYHTLAFKPALKAKKMPPGLEDLAQALIQSGRFRVDTIVEQNFVRWGRPFENINMVFSQRELTDPELIQRTAKTMRLMLTRHYKGLNLKNKVKEELARLQEDAKKNISVDDEVEIKLARLIVQSAEPPVILLLIAEGAEVFVSYSYSVGDMLDIQTWQEAGDSSGLQSSQRTGHAVFVSCGGNPLVTKKNDERPSDGFEALSRMVVIAGQELAHYADIRRGHGGGRFSADYWMGAASKPAKFGRLNDMQNVYNWHNRLRNLGLKRIAEIEQALKFYREHRKFSLIVLFTKIKAYLYQAVFIILCKINNIKFLNRFFKDEYMCHTISIMLSDMLFNLEPNHEAYKRPDPVEEEMIMCIEALARVQQQANKWGKDVTKIMYPNLYEIYYNQVLPACIDSYEKITGTKYPAIFTEK